MPRETTPKPLLVLQGEMMHQSLPTVAAAYGDTAEVILRGLAIDDRPAEIVMVCEDEPLPPLEEVSGVVMSGAAAMVADPLPWIGRTADYLRAAVATGVPTLGLCFGHQLLAHAFGGRVAPLSRGPEYGTVTIERTAESAGDAMLGAAPARFLAQAAHHQTVVVPPLGAVVLARNGNGVQALRYAEAAWGVQFHPEFDDGLNRLIIEAVAETLSGLGVDTPATLAALTPSPDAAAVLRRFGAVLRARAAAKAA